MIEQRMHFRKALQVEATIADVLGNTWSPVKLLDISVGGAAFISPLELGANASRMLRFHLPGTERPMHFLIRVANCNKHTFLDGYRIGASFLRVNDDDKAALNAFIGSALGS